MSEHTWRMLDGTPVTIWEDEDWSLPATCLAPLPVHPSSAAELIRRNIVLRRLRDAMPMVEPSMALARALNRGIGGERD